jgi:YVTN family beta-propeller protein
MNIDIRSSKPAAGGICLRVWLAPVRIGCTVAVLTLWPLAGHAQSITATVTAGTSPSAVAVNPVSNRIYVANTASNTVTVIDGATNTTATVAVGSGPSALAVNPVTNKIYVANSLGFSVTVIDGATNATTSVTVGSLPGAVAVNPVTNKIYVANTGNGATPGTTVTVIDGVTNATTPVATGSEPFAVAVNPATNKIYVPNFISNNVTIIDGATNNTTTVAAGTNPVRVAVNPVTNRIYVTSSSSTNNVTVINGATNATAMITAGGFPQAVVVNPVTDKIYVANSNGANPSTMTVIDGPTNATTPVNTGGAVAVNPVTDTIYVANIVSNNVAMVDGATNGIAIITAGTLPQAVAVNPVTNKIYVANSGNPGTVTVIDGATNSTATVGVGTFPYDVAVNPVTNKIFVANLNSNNVTVIDGATNATTTVAAGRNPTAVAVNPVTNKIYVVNSDGNITVIDGATNATTTLAGVSGSLAVNPVTDKIYVSTATGRGFIVIDGATNTTTAVAFVNGSVAINPVTNKIYVINGNITVIDGATNATTTVTGVAGPGAVAVNPITNKIYVANLFSNNVTVIDGVTNSTATITAGTTPTAVAVNPLTNKIYVTNEVSNTVTVIDGATNTTTTVAVGFNPLHVAVNSATNKVYVGGSPLTAIDGATNTTTSVTDPNTLPCGGGNALTVNAVTNKIYVVNPICNSVTVITEQQVQPSPLTTAITPLPGNTTTSAAQAFQFAASNSSPKAPPVTNLYFQFDTFEGPWSQGTPGTMAGSFTGAASGLALGTHILYAFATDGEEATSVMQASSPVIGGIAAYLFDELGIPTSTTLTTDLNPALPVQQVTFTAAVFSSTTGTPSGSASFFDGSTFLGNVALDTTGHAAFTTISLTSGVHSITAVYIPSPSAGFAASTSAALSETILTPTSTALTFSAIQATFGQLLTFTATVVPDIPSGTPTGTVLFNDGTMQIGTGTLNASAQATFSTSSLAVGNHLIRARYLGDANFAPASSAPMNEPVSQAATSTVVASSAAMVTVGQQVTFTATVSSAASATPTGSVAFLDGSTQIGTGALGANPQATFSTSSLSLGTHSITAKYSGDANFFGSTSTAMVTEMVIGIATTTAVMAAPTTATTGQQVTFTATVSKAAGSIGTPTGMVTFRDGSTALGTGTLNTSGVATFATSSLAAGSHSITAFYGGDSNFAPSTSTALTETINAPLDFLIGAAAGGSTSATVKAGQTAMYALQFSVVGGAATDQLTLTVNCTGAPPKAACSGPASPVTVTQAAPATVTIDVSTTANALLIPTAPSWWLRTPGNRLPILWVLPMLLALLWLRRYKQTETRAWAASPAFAMSVLLLAMMGAAMSGCGGGSGYTPPPPPPPATGTPPGTYTLTVTVATSSNLTHSEQLTLMVQ